MSASPIAVASFRANSTASGDVRKQTVRQLHICAQLQGGRFMDAQALACRERHLVDSALFPAQQRVQAYAGPLLDAIRSASHSEMIDARASPRLALASVLFTNHSGAAAVARWRSKIHRTRCSAASRCETRVGRTALKGGFPPTLGIGREKWMSSKPPGDSWLPCSDRHIRQYPPNIRSAL